MINAVAKNTRVLGFNAGIEAARSGEHGRGFSVVAKEITKLADQSANSVNEIKQLLDELNDKVEHVANIVEDTVQISASQTTAIEEISQSIQYLTDGAEEIEEMAKKI
jgi:methyl-accepting chemotaxis protein